MQGRNPAENADIRRLRVRISKKVVRACAARCYRGSVLKSGKTTSYAWGRSRKAREI